MTFVTFIVPTIGRPSLEQTLGSLTWQTDGDWEAVVMADGLMELANYNCDSRIRWWANPVTTGSAGLTRNAAIKVAPESRWFAFVDDDDSLREDYVELLREADDEEEPDVVVFRMLHPTLGVLPDPEEPRLEYGRVGISYAVRTHWFGVHQFLREDLQNQGPRGNEDIALLTDLIHSGAKVCVHPEITYFVRSAKP